MLFLVREDLDGTAEMFATPRLNLSDAEGKFRFTGLAAGTAYIGWRLMRPEPPALLRRSSSRPNIRFAILDWL